MKPATEKPSVRTIAAGKFKATCLQLMDEVLANNLTLIVTKRGKPVMHATAPREIEETFRPLWSRSPAVKVPDDIKKRLDWGDPVDKWKRANKEKKAR